MSGMRFALGLVAADPAAAAANHLQAVACQVLRTHKHTLSGPPPAALYDVRVVSKDNLEDRSPISPTLFEHECTREAA